MNSPSDSLKVTSKPTFRRSVIDTLDPFHKTAAEVLAERGLIRITDEGAPA